MEGEIEGGVRIARRHPRPRRSLLLPIAVLNALRLEARRHGIRADDLAEAVLAIVAADDLYSAVLDR